MPSPLTGASSAGIESIRTLALVGPAAAGKTSLAEALLVASGAIGTPGSARARDDGQRLRSARAAHAALAQRRGAASARTARRAST